MGYHRAGFDVVGVDIKPQPRYPFRMVVANALRPPFDLREFDAIHASPPCQAFTRLKNIRGNGGKHPQLVEDARALLISSGLPWVIENVPGAPLIDPVILCGTMFEGLRVYRHRLFECSWGKPVAPGVCNHQYVMGPSRGAYHRLDESEFITCVGHNFQAKSGRIAMKIDWMTRDEMAQAIPPAYTEYIGKQLLKAIGRAKEE